MANASRRRVAAIAVAALGVMLLQGCAVTTGRYVADRSPVASHSMVSRFDVRLSHLQAAGGTPSTGSALHMPQPQPYSRYLFYY